MPYVAPQQKPAIVSDLMLMALQFLLLTCFGRPPLSCAEAEPFAMFTSQAGREISHTGAVIFASQDVNLSFFYKLFLCAT